MFKFLVLTTLFATCFATPFFLLPPVKERITGGINAAPGEIKSMVAMYRESEFRCGGSIIRDDVVLTVASCVSTELPASSFSFRAGSLNRSSGGQVLSASAYKLHENYVGASNNMDSDIALILMNGRFIFNNMTNVIKLPVQNEGVAVGSLGLTSGWGKSHSFGQIYDLLRRVNIPIVDQELCTSRFEEAEKKVTENMICAGMLEIGKHGPCSRDNGGPLIVDNKIVGMFSWFGGCGSPYFPAVYVRVAKFIDWIHSSVAVMENM